MITTSLGLFHSTFKRAFADAQEKQTHEKELAACKEEKAKAEKVHKKELAVSLAREAEEKQTHEKELAACKEQKAKANNAHEKELTAKHEQMSEILSRYQVLHASLEEAKLQLKEKCTRAPDNDLIHSLKAHIARLETKVQLQVSLYSFCLVHAACAS